MTTLSQCMECGGLVSFQASQCPRCLSRYPLGVKCIVCCQVLKRSEALKIKKEYGGANNSISVKFFHHSCYNHVNQLRMGRSRTSCPTCKYSIEFDTSSSINCSNCGQKISTRLQDPSFAPCCYCGFSLNKNLEVEVKQVSRPFLEGWVTETLYGHKICYTKERQDQEKRAQQKERIEKERIAIKRSANLREKQSSRTRETLFLSIFLGLAIGILIGGLGGVIAHFIFGFASSWQVAALLGFFGVSLLTIVAVWIFSIFD